MVSDTLNYILVFRKRKSGTDEQSVLFLTDSPDPRGVPFLGKGPGTDKAPAGVNSNHGALCAVGPVNLPVPRGGDLVLLHVRLDHLGGTVPREEPDPPCSTTTARAISGSS